MRIEKCIAEEVDIPKISWWGVGEMVKGMSILKVSAY